MPNYPGSLDALANPGATTKRNDPGYELHTVISTLNDATEAIETKLGTGASVAAANQVLRGTGAGATAFGQIVAGDLTSGVVAMVKIGEALGSGGSGDLTLSSLPATYRALYFEIMGRSSNASLNTVLSLLINGDSGANYDSQRSDVQATTHTGAEAFGQTSMALGYMPGSTATANVAGSARGELPHHGETVFNKMVHWQAHIKYGTASSNLINTIGSGQWRNTAAITSLTLRLTAGNWITGSKLTVWGLPA